MSVSWHDLCVQSGFTRLFYYTYCMCNCIPVRLSGRFVVQFGLLESCYVGRGCSFIAYILEIFCPHPNYDQPINLLF